MRLLPLAFTLLAATVLGLGVTWFAVSGSRGLDVVRSGPWEGWPRAGTVKADPYARAALARSGELPIELADGLLFLAGTDDAGRPIDGRCVTRISGVLPQARLWTLTLMDSDGRLIPNDAGRYGLTSAEAVYTDQGAIDVRLSPRARSGNWLPTGARSRVKVVLRLYDAPFSFASGAGDAMPLPHIVQEGCP
ncbi:DUF1214 domain-containing protein [Xanthobacter tagetidis]|uniref:DUF1214 domain-containing protein n=1 Tax=Xanthobacter tagetidis TaxID=60216 RepID=A0A3L7A896_9HYPH|nr:DUF1214 domain-containing protein [Xanthobacter tagetidis]MBB6307253.1 hypothetical protein [Xanthobacter tagetidis]RLP75801.1 DUF1214 domain-containing protein [Xanthobacter tagetidis]